ncbi:MAG: hypothetical protein KKC51_03595, partial [Verrucomicrobia bacterium]|nr:hypothetical protein [Verrucomicrobiota bacterium]
MKLEQISWSEPKQSWTMGPPGQLAESAQWVLLFGDRSLLKNGARLKELKQIYRNAHFLGCSTAGEICGKEVRDQTLVATAVHLEHSVVAGAKINIRDVSDSFQAGQKLAQAFDTK